MLVITSRRACQYMQTGTSGRIEYPHGVEFLHSPRDMENLEKVLVCTTELIKKIKVVFYVKKD